jgi:AraC-like DNA-binding protein
MQSDPGATTDSRSGLRFQTDDLDEAREFVRRNFGDHARVPQQRGRLGFEIVFSAAAGSVAGMMSIAVPTVVRASSRAVTVHLPRLHGAIYRVGRRSLRSAPDVAVALMPDHDYTVRTPPGPADAFLLDPQLLERALDDVRGNRMGSWLLESMEIPLSAAEAADFRRIVRQRGMPFGHGLERCNDLALPAIERRMAIWLAGRIAGVSAVKTISQSSRQLAEQVDAWIRGHVSQPITLDQLSAVAGVGGRTLQKACLARWGQSPLELVTSRRLGLVRSWLTSDAHARSVTEAAVRSGFTHLGRFSVLYKRAYGESPSDTLAARRARPGAHA